MCGVAGGVRGWRCATTEHSCWLGFGDRHARMSVDDLWRAGTRMFDGVGAGTGAHRRAEGEAAAGPSVRYAEGIAAAFRATTRPHGPRPDGDRHSAPEE